MSAHFSILRQLKSLITFLTLIAFITGITPSFALAQEIDYLEDDGDSLWEEEKFLDVTGSEFETGDTQYVGEEEVKAAEAARKAAGIPTIDLAAALEKDKEMLPDNIMYGVGTGAMIGGWFALVQGGTARDNVRYLTVGILAGVLLGTAVGNKALFMQRAPGGVLNQPSSQPEPNRFLPQVQVAPTKVALNWQMTF